MKYGTVTAQFRVNGFSDHSPVHIKHSSIGGGSKRPFRCLTRGGSKRPFRFLNILVEYEEFIPTVEASWKQEVRGSNMYRV